MKIVKNNQKGFSLIELIAVIAIIGILIAILIPAVSKYISDSRKETYKNSIHEFGKYVKLQFANDYASQKEINLHEFSEIKQHDANSIKSPYGAIDEDNTLVISLCLNGNCEFYIQVVDVNDNGVELTSVNDLSSITSSDVKKVVVKVNKENLKNNSLKKGDADLDGKLTIYDSSIIQKYLSGVENISPIAIYFGDTNNNGKLDYCDANSIQLISAGLTIVYGDINQDGKVDNNDYNALLSALQNNTSFSQLQKRIVVDLNCDNIVNQLDLDILKKYLDKEINYLPYPD